MEIKRSFTTIDTHTSGGPTRIITSGIPKLLGSNVAEKMNYFKNHHDSIRKLLLNEPRGHADMYGAVITEATHPDADLGAFFMTTLGYLPACVHSSIGVATAFLKTGSLNPCQATKEICLETPIGVISLYPNYQAGKLASISLHTKPAYVHEIATELNVGGMNLQISVVFSGVFFALVDVEQFGRSIDAEYLPEFVLLGQEILKEANNCLEVLHPEIPDLRTLDLVMFYKKVDRQHARDIVVSRIGNVDRSPCGAGTGALVVYQMDKGDLDVGELYTTESIIGSHFSAQVVHPVEIGKYSGAILQINGSAFITGFQQFILETDDPLDEGFEMLCRD